MGGEKHWALIPLRVLPHISKGIGTGHTWSSIVFRVYIPGERVRNGNCDGDVGSSSENRVKGQYQGVRRREIRSLLGVNDQEAVFGVSGDGPCLRRGVRRAKHSPSVSTGLEK